MYPPDGYKMTNHAIALHAARRAIGEYVEYYLKDRKHSALGYLTPQQFERLQGIETDQKGRSRRSTKATIVR